MNHPRDQEPRPESRKPECGLLWAYILLTKRGQKKTFAVKRRLSKQHSSETMADLEDVQTVDLMSELLRRLKCAQKPEKCLIFIGMPPIAYLGKRLNLIRLSL